VSTPTKAPPSALHDPDSPAGRLGLAFKRAMVAVRRLRGRETHRPGQPSHAQYALLFALAEHGERSARELAERADLTPGTVAQMLEHLEAHGLVARTRSELDRRIVLSSLTEQGAATVVARRALFEDRWKAALAEFSDEELDTAARVVGRLGDYFDGLLEDPPEA
jgi:DNA-binding MarR family transcriptional regulator